MQRHVFLFGGRIRRAAWRSSARAEIIQLFLWLFVLFFLLPRRVSSYIIPDPCGCRGKHQDRRKPDGKSRGDQDEQVHDCCFYRGKIPFEAILDPCSNRPGTCGRINGHLRDMDGYGAVIHLVVIEFQLGFHGLQLVPDLRQPLLQCDDSFQGIGLFQKPQIRSCSVVKVLFRLSRSLYWSVTSVVVSDRSVALAWSSTTWRKESSWSAGIQAVMEACRLEGRLSRWMLLPETSDCST